MKTVEQNILGWLEELHTRLSEDIDMFKDGIYEDDRTEDQARLRKDIDEFTAKLAGEYGTVPFLYDMEVKTVYDDYPDLSYLDQYEDSDDPEEQKYYEQDQKRKESYGDTWNMVGIKAVATIYIPFKVVTNKGEEINFHVETIDSGGLWSIESDSDKTYFTEVAEDQINHLKGYLDMLNVNTKGGFRLFPNSDLNKKMARPF